MTNLKGYRTDSGWRIRRNYHTGEHTLWEGDAYDVAMYYLRWYKENSKSFWKQAEHNQVSELRWDLVHSALSLMPRKYCEDTISRKTLEPIVEKALQDFKYEGKTK